MSNDENKELEQILERFSMASYEPSTDFSEIKADTYQKIQALITRKQNEARIDELQAVVAELTIRTHNETYEAYAWRVAKVLGERLAKLQGEKTQ